MTRKRAQAATPPEEARGKGQPTKLTDTVQAKVLEALRAGSYKTVAAAYAGVSVSSIYHWLEWGEADLEAEKESIYADFFQAVKKAEADHEVTALLVLDRAASTGKGSWQAAAWKLERKHPDRWGRRQRVEGLTPEEFDEQLANLEDELSELNPEALAEIDAALAAGE